MGIDGSSYGFPVFGVFRDKNERIGSLGAPGWLAIIILSDV